MPNSSPNNPIKLNDYDPVEEKYNAWSHGLAALLAILALALMLIKVSGDGLSHLHLAVVLIYGFSMILLFGASTLYHMSRDPTKRLIFKKLDHASIYIFIAATYAPFLLIGIDTAGTFKLMIALWLIALIGVVFKLFFVHAVPKLSLFVYLLMGWLAILAIDDMTTFLSTEVISWIVAGGLAYTVGAGFYAAKKLRFTHAIWHFFVILGAACHFIGIYCYIL